MHVATRRCFSFLCGLGQQEPNHDKTGCTGNPLFEFGCRRTNRAVATFGDGFNSASWSAARPGESTRIRNRPTLRVVVLSADGCAPSFGPAYLLIDQNRSRRIGEGRDSDAIERIRCSRSVRRAMHLLLVALQTRHSRRTARGVRQEICNCMALERHPSAYRRPCP
jgi:hypothetical protein